MAIKIDQELPKEKILELYLNKIYLGNRAYGVGAAAQIYYGKDIQELSIAELAMIAGLPQAPSAHNPIANPKAAEKRRNHVLSRLLEEQFITQKQYDEAISEPIRASYHGPQIEVHAPYVAEMIRQSLYTHFGEEAYTQGIKVYTTIDSHLQNTASNLVEIHLLNYEKRHGYRGASHHFLVSENAGVNELKKDLQPYSSVNDLIPAIVTEVRNQSLKVYNKNNEFIEIPWAGLSWARPALKKGWTGRSPLEASDIVKRGDLIYVRKEKGKWCLTQIPQLESALVSMHPQDGAIKALVGGFNFYTSKFNHVTQSIRQPGSSFKPFIYAAALNKGYTLASIVNDAPIVINDTGRSLWRPHNDNHTFNGPTRIREALAYSRNLVSIRLLDDIGIDYAIEFVSRFGFNKTQMPHALSLALGTLSVTPMELTTGYAIIANGGYRVEPYLIDHVTNRHGETLLMANPTHVCQPEDSATQPNCAPEVIPNDLAFLVHSALQSVIDHGTAISAKSLGRKDLAGKTGTTNDQVDAWFAGYHPQLVTVTWFGYDTPLPLHEYGSKLALPLWVDYMKVALKKLPELVLSPPETIRTIKINPETGLRIPSEEPGIEEYFKTNQPPLRNNDEQSSNEESDEEIIPESYPSESEESLF